MMLVDANISVSKLVAMDKRDSEDTIRDPM
jgi:hypothetical protein